MKSIKESADTKPAEAMTEAHTPTRGKVTESIYDGQSITVPLADVQHIEKHNPLGLIVVTKHTRWDAATGGWANSIWIDKATAPDFLAAWCRYRHELEQDTLADLRPDAVTA